MSPTGRVLLALACCPLAAWAAGADLSAVLAGELQRNFGVLKEKADPAPYYLAYQVTEQQSETISATLGGIQSVQPRRLRYLDISLRVGSPKLDNYHPIRGQRGRFTFGAALSIDDIPDAIRQRVWWETDRVYRLAVQRLIDIRTNKEVRVAETDASEDFSMEPAARFEEQPPALRFSTGDWSARLRRLSGRFASHPAVITSSVTVTALREEKTFVDSEGTRIRHGRLFSRLTISARAKASDGMDLAAGDSFEAGDPSRLPPDREIEAAIDRVIADLEGLLQAPVVEPFVGPAILSGRAAGVFFHEIFGHRVEGHRQKDETEGQTFTKAVGTRILPEFLSVTFDPTRKTEADHELNGWYAYDDEGVKARRVNLVEDGVLKTFLMSRTPIPGFPASNGHGRRQPGLEVVSRQSNLFVESSRSLPEAKLRELLVEEIRRQNKPYGFYFREITGGFTTTARAGIQAFKVIPVVVYRVWPDGRPDELVRGADLVGTPLASFAKIVAAGDRPGIFNGYCGAESGQVPVAAVSPALLVSEIEIQKAESSRERPPILPPPGGTQ